MSDDLISRGGVRNHEGYPDYTAYRAIRNMEKEKTMVDKIYKGDVFTVETNAEGEQMAVVISTDEVNDTNGSVVAVYLNEKPNQGREAEVTVSARGLRTANCTKIYTLNKSRLTEYVKTLTDSELSGMEDALAYTFGLPCAREEKECAEEPGQVPVQAAGDTAERIRLETERDMYKKLYEDMLERAVGR